MPCAYEFQQPHCEQPEILNEQSYESVRHLMLGTDGHQNGQRVSLVHFSSDNAQADMVAARAGVLDYGNASDTTFAQQMHEAFTGNTPPDVVLTTYRSAVPVLAAVEGYCDASKIQLPQLGHVDVSYRHRSTDFSSDAHLSKETNRLTEYLHGKNVLVIDQYISTGIALRRANSIAQAAGAVSVTGLVGYWYRNLLPSSPFSDETVYPPAEELWTGTHADFMYEVGQEAALVQRDDKSSAITTNEIMEWRKGGVLDY